METTGTYWVAVFGILGTLIGVCVGAFVTWKIQERQIKHSDATRFQEDGFNIYSQFLAAANNAVSFRNTDLPFINAFSKFLEQIEKVRLIATDDVKQYAYLLNGKFIEINKIPQNSKIPENILNEFNNIVANFVTAARKELRIKGD